MIEDIKTFYSNKLDTLSNIVKKYGNLGRTIALLRFFTFIFIPILFVLWFFTHSFNLSLILIPTFVFFTLVYFSQKYNSIYEWNKAIYDLIDSEIKYSNKDFSVFRNGAEYLDYKHEYAYDLDIFEKGSIMHTINRCSTIEGEKYLVDLLLNPKRDVNTILKNQEAIKELSHTKNREISINISALGYKNPSSLTDFIKNIKVSSNKTRKSTVYLTYISSLITLSTFVLYGFDIVYSFVPLGLFILQFSISNIYGNKTNQAYMKAARSNNSSKIYLQIARALKNVEFHSEYLKEISKNLNEMDKALTELDKINSEFQQRNNGFVYLLSNGLFLRDIVLTYKLSVWSSKYESMVDSWIETVKVLDGLNSLSTFAFNNPELIYPEINNSTIIKAKDLAHPILPSNIRIGNDIEISSLHKFLLITGANMAGKSTFIRSIGINLILASSGAPVCATSFSFTPTPLFSSMRTSDKLMDSSSYFHAELSRLKQLREKGEKEESMLVLLDEILKGTNSNDKLQGSKLVLLKLVSMNMAGILATHDTALGTLKDEYPENFANYYFDFDVDDSDEMHFDYKLKEGVTKNMNAAILLKNILED